MIESSKERWIRDAVVPTAMRLKNTREVRSTLAYPWDLIIATDVSGIFDRDPKKYPDAKLLKQVAASELLSRFSEDIIAGGYKLLDPVTLRVIIRSKRAARVISRPPADAALSVPLILSLSASAYTFP